ncbi:unnamed protein product [Cuscuta epithymum]|uniref:Uncharacterized protein n=1 Tax=Cuscuta epithymum TaxID=186058 RepID=A0AAV0FSZ5_9ASTE|nr:unnamed protein product [Cuscuta epithymum]
MQLLELRRLEEEVRHCRDKSLWEVPAKTKGRKSKTKLYAEIEKDLGKEPTVLDFGEKWEAIDPTTGQPYPTRHARYMALYRQRMEEVHGPDRTLHPVIDHDIWLEITGDSKRRRRVGIPDQISDPQLFQLSKPIEDKCMLLESQAVELRSEIDTMRGGMAELKAQNEAMRAENEEQRASFNAAMSNVWGVLISMGVASPSMIPSSMVAGGSSSQHHQPALFGQLQTQQPSSFGQRPGPFGQLFGLTYAQAQHQLQWDQPPHFGLNGFTQPASSQVRSTEVARPPSRPTMAPPTVLMRTTEEDLSSSDGDDDQESD